MLYKRTLGPWFQTAFAELKMALDLSQNSNDLGPDIFKHCLCVAQHSMRGFLTFQSINFQDHHDLVDLLGLIASVEPALASKLGKNVALLNQIDFGLDHRKSKVKELSEDQIDNIIRLCKESFDLVISAVPFGAQWTFG